MTNSENLIKLQEQLNTVNFQVPERDRLERLLQDQFETVAVRLDDSSPWGDGNRAPVRGVIVTGGHLAGKSDLVQQCIESVTAVASVDGQVIEPDIAIVDAPSTYTQSSQARLMLRSLGYPTPRKMTPDLAWEKVRDRLPKARLTGMVIDDYQWSFKPSFVGRHTLEAEKVKIQGAYNAVMADASWPLPLVLVGRTEIKDALAAREMAFFRERCDLIEIAPLSPGDQSEHSRLRTGIQALCEKANLTLNLHPQDLPFSRLIHAADGQRALAVVTAKLAVLEAVRRSSNRLELSHFKAVYEAHSGSSDPDTNPFAAEAWHTVKTGELARSSSMPITEMLRPMNRPSKEQANA